MSFPITVGLPAPDDAHRNGPLFRILQDGMSDLERFLTGDISMRIGRNGWEGHGIDEVGRALAKIEADCDGPLSLDEGLQTSVRGDDSWVQVAWVCNANEDVSVREFFGFDHSPEISAAFTLKDGKATSIFMLEQMGMPPDFTVLPMDAYQRVRGGQ